MNYLILGANAAGMSAAVRIQKLDKTAKVTVIEKSDVVSFGSCGIPYYVADQFDDIDRMTARPYEEFIKSGIDLRLHHMATAIDSKNKHVQVLDTQTNTPITLNYDKLLIAVGASPSIPPIKGLQTGNVYTMHSKYDALNIKQALPNVEKVVVIGAGFIGIEAVEAFREQGKDVTLIEFATSVLERTFDKQITDLLQQHLQEHNVALHTQEQVTEIVSQNGNASHVVTNKGQYPADLVILATGFKPNTEFLRASDLQLTPQGAIMINRCCETSLPDVYAAGDCATVHHIISGDSYIPLATTANKLGRLAGEAMAGKHVEFMGTLGSSGVRLFDMEAGRTGITENEAKTLNIDYGTVFIKDKNRTDYLKNQTDMWVKLVYDKQSRKILGGQICGAYLGGAVHRVDALAVAIYKGMTVEELGFMDFVYAPPFARTWDILNIAGNVAK